MQARRIVKRVIPGQAVSDGAGVQLRRSLGQSPHTRLDPFLMLDEFSSENPDDYVAGFPSHPHRGFETVTYMLDGHMLHEDHLGNRGHLKSGGAQWMTAGRGIIHSEMPQQESGRMRGFQLWINLPAREKMKAAGYCDIQADEIPQATLASGAKVKVIAGEVDSDGASLRGPILGVTTAPLFIDVTLPPGVVFTQAIAASHHAFVYPFEGDITIDDRTVSRGNAAELSAGDHVVVNAPAGARFILLAAIPLNEPVVQYGPFVMNSREEIEQALRDYSEGTLTA